MTEGYYCIPIAIYLHGKDGSEETDYMNIWISEQTTTDKETTEETSADIVFVMGEEQNIPYGVFPDVMDFSINLRNKSHTPAYDVTVSMVLNKSDDEFPFMIYDGNYDRHFDVIEAGEMVGLPYTMAIREDSYTGYYPIKFKISYRESINGDEKVAEGPGLSSIQNREQRQVQIPAFRLQIMNFMYILPAKNVRQKRRPELILMKMTGQRRGLL